MSGPTDHFTRAPWGFLRPDRSPAASCRRQELGHSHQIVRCGCYREHPRDSRQSPSSMKSASSRATAPYAASSVASSRSTSSAAVPRVASHASAVRLSRRASARVQLSDPQLLPELPSEARGVVRRAPGRDCAVRRSASPRGVHGAKAGARTLRARAPTPVDPPTLCPRGRTARAARGGRRSPGAGRDGGIDPDLRKFRGELLSATSKRRPPIPHPSRGSRESASVWLPRCTGWSGSVGRRESAGRRRWEPTAMRPW